MFRACGLVWYGSRGACPLPLSFLVSQAVCLDKHLLWSLGRPHYYFVCGSPLKLHTRTMFRIRVWYESWGPPHLFLFLFFPVGFNLKTHTKPLSRQGSYIDWRGDPTPFLHCFFKGHVSCSRRRHILTALPFPGHSDYMSGVYLRKKIEMIPLNIHSRPIS